MGRLVSAIPALLLGLYAVCTLSLWVEAGWRPEWDSALYILTGRSLAAGEGYRYLGEPFVLRPPGFAWLIAQVQGPGAFEPAVLNRMVMGFAAAAVAALYLALRPRHGRWLALAVALLVGTTPPVVGAFNWVVAEFPFLALLFIGMFLLECSVRSRRAWPVPALAAAVCMAGAFHMRTVALLILPGMWLASAARPGSAGRGRVALSMGVAAALMLPWLRHTVFVRDASGPPPDQLFLLDYTTAVFHVDPGNSASPWVSLPTWIARIADNAGWLVRESADAVLGSSGVGAGLALLALIVAGGLVMLRRRPGVFEWFGAVYAAVLLTYFTHTSRLLIPLMPCLYLFLLLGAASLARRLPISRLLGSRWGGDPGRTARGVGGALFLVLLSTNLVRLPELLDPRRSGGQTTRLGADWEDTAYVARWIRSSTPRDAVILCNQAPVYALLTGREAYTYRFARETDLLEKYAPDYVVFDAARDRELEARVARVALRRGSLSRPGSLRSLRVYGLTEAGDLPGL